jgi:hypothetical protein
MPPNSLCPLKFLLQTSNYVFVYIDSLYSIRNIPFVGRPYVLNVIDCLKAILFITHASSKLKDLNYDKFHIEIVHCILTTFNGDVLFELLLVNPDN